MSRGRSNYFLENIVVISEIIILSNYKCLNSILWPPTLELMNR
jgi:hypothetical protein